MAKKSRRTTVAIIRQDSYDAILAEVVELLESARRGSARAVNAVMTATYWRIGRRIVDCEQDGRQKARYGERLIERLSKDLTARYGRGFSYVNLTQMRRFYSLWPMDTILQTPSEEFTTLPQLRRPVAQTPVRPKSQILQKPSEVFPLPWSHYVRLLSVDNPNAPEPANENHSALPSDFPPRKNMRNREWPLSELNRYALSGNGF